jgi:acetyltransferase-like isoleucine patch superfamily enzyme
MFIGWLQNNIGRLKALRHVEIQGARSRFLFSNCVTIRCAKNARIVVNNAVVRLGYPLPGLMRHAHFPMSEITLSEGATLVFDGDVCIAPGATIYVGKGATAVFAGNNFVSYNFKLICNREFRFGRFSNLSWGVTLIDDDLHRLRTPEGKLLRTISRPLIVGTNVGIQMNVSIPRGVTVGNNSVIAGGLVLREDIPENSTAFGEVKLKVKHGFCAGPTPVS